MIISASRRTDIPAFYSDWFYNRITEGFVLIRNPMNIHQLSKIILSPEFIDCIVLWTKNPSRFIKRLPELQNFNFYFQYTITGYGRKLEPNVPELKHSITCFTKIAKMIGLEKVIWRYDPIIITDVFDIDFHIKNFEVIARNLSGYTRKCVISFVDYYKKTIKNLSSIHYSNISPTQMPRLIENLSLIGKKFNIEISSCAEEVDLTAFDISHGKCIDDKLIKEITGFSLNIAKDKSQRKECGCVASIDIGAYNTCPHNCLYCYANYNLNQVRNNYILHNSSSSLLFGNITNMDKIILRKMYSCRDIQQNIFNIS